jgi:putative membrane protein
MRTLHSFWIGTGLAAFVCISPGLAQTGQGQDGGVGQNGSVNPAAKTAPIGATALGPNSPATGYASQANVSENNTDRLNGSRLTAPDRHFVHAAAQGGMLEVNTGKFAGQNAATYEVRALGRRLARDHARLGDQLGEIARSKGIRVPMALDAEHLAMADRLEGMPKGGFDHAYLMMLADCHRKDIAAFEKEAATGGDADLRAFAQQALPTLRGHLRMIEANMGR